MNRLVRVVLVFSFVCSFGLVSSEAAWPHHRLFQPVQYYALGPKEALFANDSLENWMNARERPVRSGWDVKDGVVRLTGRRGGDIITKKAYKYFVFECDWAIAENCNSGIKYRYTKFDDRWLGCEYQILDDERSKESNPKNQTASLYDVFAPTGPKELKPIGEFNHTKIVVLGNRIEHWLNGKKVLVVNVGSPEWKKKIKESKFNGDLGFGENLVGHIMLQDHGGDTQFKNVTIREYKPAGKTCRLTF